MDSHRPRTLYEKIWDSHVVQRHGDGTCTIYIDRHLLDEHSSPQAFQGLRQSGRKVRRPEATHAVADHNVPTRDRERGIQNEDSRIQVAALESNVRDFGVPYFGLDDPRQGIVHVIGPEQGFTLPGTTIVSGDSHASTHGAFGALAFGIGTSEVEHVLATQSLLQRPSKRMRIVVDGDLGRCVSAKDLALHLVGLIGTAGATGHAIEYAGETIRALGMEGRMTICNMSIELGARVGTIAPDETTFRYLEGRPATPKGDDWRRAVAHWRQLHSDSDAVFDREIAIDAGVVEPCVTWGTSPQDVLPIGGTIPDPASAPDADRRAAWTRALAYMDLTPGTRLTDIRIDRVFIGSCTNGRIEDLREAAAIVRGRRIAGHVGAMVVPGSGLVKRQAEDEGLDRIFVDAGFEWRQPGCSMCLAMNGDALRPGERCASTSNRNFEGRQGRDGRTHLVSPAMAAAAAIAGRLTDVRTLG